jgi:GAF domain-containing protein
MGRFYVMKNRKTSRILFVVALISMVVLLLSLLLLHYQVVTTNLSTANKQTKSFYQYVIPIVITLLFGVLWYVVYRIQQKYERYMEAHASQKNAERIRMEGLKNFVNEIASGNFNYNFSFDTSHDGLATTLVSMKEKLQRSFEEDQQRNWAANGLAEIAGILRSNTKNYKELYNNIIRFVVKYTKSNQGNLFIINSNNREKYLELVSCYAYDRQKYLTKTIEIGQGLVGQAVLEKRSVHITKIPQDYLRITSGLGEANPRALLIVPLKSNDEIFGVLELASFDTFQPYQISFIEKLGESIASSIASIRIAEQTERLLSESLQNTEELRSKEEEMRQGMEELQAIQEEMIRKEKTLSTLLEESSRKEVELQHQLKEIENLKDKNEKIRIDLIEILNQMPAKIFLKDSQGYMLLCNAEVARRYNLSIDQIIGTHDRDHFAPELAEQYAQTEREIMKEGAQTYVQEEDLKGKITYLKTTKMPFFIRHLNETGLLGYQFDVTQSYEWEHKEKEFVSEITRLNDVLNSRPQTSSQKD